MTSKCPTCGAPVTLAPDGDPRYRPAAAKPARFTDAEAAQRLQERRARELAAFLDAENLHSAEDHMKISARTYLKKIAENDT